MLSIEPGWVTAAIAGVGVVVGNAIVYYLQNRQHKFNAMNKVFDIMLDTADARGSLYSAANLYKEKQEMTHFSNNVLVEKVRTTLNLVGVLYDKGSLPRTEIMELYWQTFIDCWIAMKPYIDYKRTMDGRLYAQYFERLYHSAVN